MGMVWVARLADDAETARVMADPDSAYDFVNPEDGYEDESRIADLDKEWHAAHHLLTGSAEPTDSPLSLILGAFEEVGEDNGYGPAWYIPPDKLRAFHEAIAQLDDSDLRSRYDPDAMATQRIYLGEMYRDAGDEGFAFLLDRIGQLREFAAKGSASGLGAFAVIT